MSNVYKALEACKIYRLPKKKKKWAKLKNKSNKAKKRFIPWQENKAFLMSDDFLRTRKWRALRYEVLLKYDKRCQCCGVSPKDGAVLNVDHIKPRATHPQLALDINNLQILCHDCNHGKGNWDMTDHRP